MAVVIRTVSDSKDAQKDLSHLRESVDGINRSAEKVSKTFSTFATVLTAGFAAAGIFTAFTRSADAVTNMSNKLRIVTKDQIQLNFALRQTKAIAMATRTDLLATTTLYGKISLASKSLGASQMQVGAVTATINKSLALSGATAEETRSTILQMGQALSSGKLAGDELRSVMEAAPNLVREIATGMGKSIGDMRKLGEQGALTSEVVFRAILKRQKEIDKQFATMQVTYASAFVNMKNSLIILFGAVQRTLFKTGGSFAEMINNVAKNIASFASNFELHLLLMRNKVYLFVVSAMATLDKLWDSTKSGVARFSKGLIDAISSISPVFATIISGIVTAGTAAFSTLTSMFNGITKHFQLNGFVGGIISLFDSAIRHIRAAVSAMFTKLPSIDIEGIFPGMTSVISFVKKVVMQIEGWFAWLYDRVIGHSWIPDLVRGVTDWMGKLLGKPLAIIKSFTGQASGLFARIGLRLGLLGAISLILKYRGIVLKTLAALTAVAGIWVLLSKADFTVVKDKSGKWIDGYKSKVIGLTTYIKKLWKTINEMPVVHTFKQMFGMKDNYEGKTLTGEIVDPNAEVGGGPERKYKNRSLGHDFLQAFPKEMQIPVATAIAGAFGLAIMKVVPSGPVRTVLLQVLTTVWAASITRGMYEADLHEMMGKYANTFVKGVAKGLEFLYGKNAAKDPFGTIATTAKLALAFKEGRAMLLEAGKAVAFAPTNLVNNTFDKVALGMMRNRQTGLTSEISVLEQRKDAENAKYTTKLFADSVRQLARTVNPAGQQIGSREAMRAVRAGSLTGASQSTQLLIQNTRNLYDTAVMHERNAKETAKQISNLRDASSKLEDSMKPLQKQVNDARFAFRNAINQVAAGTGGLVGGISGFQIAHEFAQGLSAQTSEWTKVGITIAGGMIGQGVGAAMGILMANAMVAIFSKFIVGVLLAGLYRWLGALGVLFMTRFLGGLSTVMITRFLVLLGVELAAIPLLIGFGLATGAVIIALAVGLAIGTALKKFWDWLQGQRKTPEQKQKAAENNAQARTGNNKLPEGGVIYPLGDELYFLSPQRYATGGKVRGPGTGTSDSIPAALSNGEFVVNARAAQKNAAILERINSGQRVLHFNQLTSNSLATGGAMDPAKKMINELEKSNDIAEEEKSMMGKLLEAIKNAFGIKGFTAADVPKPPEDTTDKTTLTYRLENDKAAPYGEIAKRINELSGGKTKYTAKTFADERMDTDDVKIFAQMIDSIDAFRKVPDPSALNIRMQGETSRKLVSTVAERIKEMKGAVVTDESGTTKLDTWKQQLDNINAAFGELNITSEEFIRMPGEMRASISAAAKGIVAAQENLENSSTTTQEDIAKFTAERAKGQKKAFETLSSIRGSYDIRKQQFDNIGLDMDQGTLDALQSGKFAGAFEDAVKGMTAAQDQLKRRELGPQARIAEQKKFDDIAKSVERMKTDSLRSIAGTRESLKAYANDVGITIDDSAYALMDYTTRQVVAEYVAAAVNAARVISDHPEMDEKERARVAAEGADAVKKAQKIVDSRSVALKSKAEDAGDALSASVTDGFKTSLNKLLKKGKFSFSSIIDNFTNSILDNFIEGMTQRLTGEGSPIDSMMKTLGASVFGIVGGKQGRGDRGALSGEYNRWGMNRDFGGILGSRREPGMEGPQPFDEKPRLPPKFGDPISLDTMTLADTIRGDAQETTSVISEEMAKVPGIFSSLGNSVTSGLSSVFTKIDFGAIFKSISGFFAEGGKVGGPGTGTSDSIPAMLSNGEFVVNAAQARRNIGLLHAINSGQVRRLADGGEVTPVLMSPKSVDAAKEYAKPAVQSNAQFNIDFTGDISRQTRAEMYRLVPQMADQIHQYNRERGRA